MKKYNQKMGVWDKSGYWRLRIYHRKGAGKQSPRYLVKCGCCDNSVEIYYSEDGLEINGVNGSREDWLNILGPLLGVK